jgi:hypothetical protein
VHTGRLDEAADVADGVVVGGEGGSDVGVGAVAVAGGDDVGDLGVDAVAAVEGGLVGVDGAVEVERAGEARPG